MKNRRINLVERAILFCWPVAFLASLIIYLITSNWDLVFSYILGVASVLLMQSLNYRMMRELFKNSPSKVKSRTILMYIARFVFFGVVLYVVQINPDRNILYTLGGLMTYPIVIFFITLIFANKGDDEENEL